MKMRLAVSVCLFSGLTLAQQPLPAQSRKLLIAALDSDFPPYNYIDERGVQAGFSLELIRAIARLSGVEIEIRSAPWHDIVRDLKKGRIDLTAMAETEKRREEFDFLSHVWNLRQVVMYPANREVYPRHLDELSHETVAVLPKSLVHELLLTLPEVRRPTLLFVSTSDEAVRSLVRGESTAVAGNELTLQFIMARNRSLRLKTVPVRSTAYHIVTSKGRAGEFAFVEKAMMRLRQTGEFEQLVEHHLILSRPPPWTGYALYLGYALAGLSLILTSIIAWNRSLRKKIKIHTREIAESLEEKMNEIRQREHTELKLRQANGRFESLINTLDGVVWEADPHTATFTFVSAPAEKLLGYPLADWYQDGFWARHIHPEDRHEAVSFCLAATARRQNHTFEYRMVAAGGSHVWVRDFVTVVVEDGVLKSLRGILLDVTELKLAEEALRDTERLTRIVIDSAPDAVVQMDAKALISCRQGCAPSRRSPCLRPWPPARPVPRRTALN
jgi:PAS domain S-box-containing protein